MPHHPVALAGRRRRAACLIAAALPLAGACHAETLLCHVSYGGETRSLRTGPVASPYTVPVQAIGSYFLFRMVWQKEPADLAAIKVYVFADRDGGAAPIQQLTHPYPPPAPARPGYGFTGLNSVYEPVRDGELQYWCELSVTAGRAP